MKVRRWLPPLLWAGVILTGTSLPTTMVPGQISTYDKALHFTIYAIFAVLLSREFSGITSPPHWRAAALAVVIAALFGAVDEWHQQFISGRSSELADWQADSVGAVFGALAFTVFRRRNRPRAITTR